MKLTAFQVFNAFPVLTAIIVEKRPLPLKGAYRLQRLHSKLAPEFETLAKKRDDLITAYDYKAPPPDNPEGEPVGQVPPDKLPEFFAAWNELGGEDIEIPFDAIPLGLLDLGDHVAGSISAQELLALGDLVADDA